MFLRGISVRGFCFGHPSTFLSLTSTSHFKPSGREGSRSFCVPPKPSTPLLFLSGIPYLQPASTQYSFFPSVVLSSFVLLFLLSCPRPSGAPLNISSITQSQTSNPSGHDTELVHLPQKGPNSLSILWMNERCSPGLNSHTYLDDQFRISSLLLCVSKFADPCVQRSGKVSISRKVTVASLSLAKSFGMYLGALGTSKLGHDPSQQKSSSASKALASLSLSRECYLRTPARCR